MKKAYSLLILILSTEFGYGQFAITPGTGGAFGRTTAPINGVGIGFFPFATQTNARLHINNFFTQTPAGPLNGLLLRSDGNSGVNNNWQLFTGPTNATTTQKFRLTSLSTGNTNNIQLSAEQDGFMDFQTDGNAGNVRMRIHHLANGVPMLPFALNANTNPANPVAGNRLTRIGISRDGNFPITRPLSVLHIGYDWPFPGNAGAQGGFRFWQDLGTMYMALTDNMYTGMREKDPTDPTGRTSKVSTGSLPTDNQDAVITWGDNSAGNAPNPGGQPNDNLAFIFHGPLTNTLPDKFAGTDYGREVMRLTGFGNAGIGPVFYDNAQPQNLLHVNNDSLLQAYVQISNKLATFQTATDGFHLGITGGPIATTGGIAEVRQYENRDMRFYTNNTQWMVIKDNLPGNIGRVGIRTNAPGNRLEVNSAAGDPGAGNVASPGGSSGIRTTNMTSNSPVLANPGLGVVSVDQNGDLIYVTSPTVGATFGGICGTTPPALTNSWEIPLGGFNYLFSGNNTGTVVNNVGIGLTTCLPQAKLHVDQSSGSVAGSIGLLVENNDIGPCNNPVPVVAIKGIVNTPSLTTGDQYRVGGWFETPFANNCGVVNNFAIYVPQNGGFVSIGHPVPSIPGGGLVDVNGTIDCTNITFNSDASLKNSVTTLPNSLNKIKSLRPVTYKWNTITDSVSQGIHAGFIAQEVDTVIPQVVRTGNTGLKTVAYTELIPYLVSGMQELIKQNKQQDSIIQVLTQNIASCCQNSAAKQTGINGNDPNALSQINITLTDEDAIVLDQNKPNPFAEQTTITYNVPEKYGFAQLIFKTVDGKIIKTVDITKKGRGQVNVFAQDLSNGLYMYTLIVDGMTIDTKKMVKQN